MSNDIYENFCRMRELIKQGEECGIEMMAAAYLELEQKTELLELQYEEASAAAEILAEIVDTAQRIDFHGNGAHHDVVGPYLIEKANAHFKGSSLPRFRKLREGLARASKENHGEPA